MQCQTTEIKVIDISPAALFLPEFQSAPLNLWIKTAAKKKIAGTFVNFFADF